MSKRLSDLVHDFRRSVIVETMLRNGGDREIVAKTLGLTMRNLERLLARYKISRRKFARKLPIPPMRGKGPP